MKKLFLSMVLTLVLAFPAMAAVKDFKTFTADVPDGWEVIEESGTVSLLAPGNVAALTFMHAPLEGATGQQIAELFMQQLKGQNLKDEGDDTFSFTFDAGSGVISNCIVSADDTAFFFISMTGDAPEISAILDSLTKK